MRSNESTLLKIEKAIFKEVYGFNIVISVGSSVSVGISDIACFRLDTVLYVSISYFVSLLIPKKKSTSFLLKLFTPLKNSIIILYQKTF